MPPVVLNVVPQTFAGLVVGSVVTVSAKPLNADGVAPPERLFKNDQELSHHVTVVVGVAAVTVLLPRMKAPLLGKAKTIAVLPVSDDGR